jgi:hypothetical protein
VFEPVLRAAASSETASYTYSVSPTPPTPNVRNNEIPAVQRTNQSTHLSGPAHSEPPPARFRGTGPDRDDHYIIYPFPPYGRVRSIKHSSLARTLILCRVFKPWNVQLDIILVLGEIIASVVLGSNGR